jgi:hypothetical protein
MTNDQIFRLALDKMPYRFTSNLFVKTSQELGVLAMYTAQGDAGRFLHKNAIRGESKRLWYRITREKIAPLTIPESMKINFDTPEQNTTDVQLAITLLKSKGYKIMAPVSEWKEI